jgi:hypothetical protein
VKVARNQTRGSRMKNKEVKGWNGWNGWWRRKTPVMKHFGSQPGRTNTRRTNKSQVQANMYHFFFLRIDLACVKKLNRQSRCFTAVQINMTISERRFAENYDFLQRLYICRILLRQYDNYVFVVHRKLQQCRQRKDRCADSMRVTFPLINLKRNCFWRSTLLS